MAMVDLSGNELSWFWKKHRMLLMRMFLKCAKKGKREKEKNISKIIDNVWRVKGLIVTCIHLVVTWKVRLYMGIIS